MKPMSGRMVNDARQFTITGFRRVAFERDQLYGDALRCLGFARILSLIPDYDSEGLGHFIQKRSEGIDIFAQEGDTVLAAPYGVVIDNGYGTVSGNYVKILGTNWRIQYLLTCVAIHHTLRHAGAA